MRTKPIYIVLIPSYVVKVFRNNVLLRVIVVLFEQAEEQALVISLTLHIFLADFMQNVTLVYHYDRVPFYIELDDVR